MADDGSENEGCAFWVAFGVIYTLGAIFLRLFQLQGGLTYALIALLALLLASPFKSK
ncbi:MAG: hypothetical protein LBR80_09870 [Deltaproteobacteria bacterium]|jgi:hypothetical protein|nr:hypothetical protein [Deltaproteobacteria bacterium]